MVAFAPPKLYVLTHPWTCTRWCLYIHAIVQLALIFSPPRVLRPRVRLRAWMPSFWPASESESADHLPRELSRSFLASFSIPISAAWLVVTPTYLHIRPNASAGSVITPVRSEPPVRELDLDTGASTSVGLLSLQARRHRVVGADTRRVRGDTFKMWELGSFAAGRASEMERTRPELSQSLSSIPAFSYFMQLYDAFRLAKLDRLNANLVVHSTA